MPKMSAKFDRAPNAGGVGQNWQLLTNNRLYLENGTRVSIRPKVEQEVVCALSNGGIAHNLECPITMPFSAFCTAIHSFVTGERC